MARSTKSTLSGLVVRQAMRRLTVQLPMETSIDHSINHLIKYKVNAVLVLGPEGKAVGVVSKSDIMGAYYAGLPIDSPLEHIMVGPPLFCRPEVALEDALDTMRTHGVYRLYVAEGKDDRILGALAYPDIVGLLYKFCHNCEYSHRHRQLGEGLADTGGERKRYRVGEVMTKAVQAVATTDPVLQAIEVLSTYRFGAVLVHNAAQLPCGVVSKTDLTLAYKHAVDPETPAGDIMSAPVQVCRTDDLLEDAIKTMIYSDVHRLFVQSAASTAKAGAGAVAVPGARAAASAVVGVFSLTDAARLRSGSCHACISSRIQLDN
jgi:CBS domain-containing protein